MSQSLIPLAVAFFNKYTFASSVINSFDQAFDVLDNLFHNSKISLEEISNEGEKIKVEFYITNLDFSPAIETINNNNIIAPTPTQAIKDGLTYSCWVTGDIIIKFTLLENRSTRIMELDYKISRLRGKEDVERPKREEISFTKKFEKAFSIPLPIPVKSKYCSLKKFSPYALYSLGEDPLDIGGWLVIEGGPKTVGCIYSYPFNHPTCIYNHGHFDQVVRTDIIFQKDVFYGSSYHIVPMIVHKKQTVTIGKTKDVIDNHDIIIVFRGFKSDMKRVEDASDQNKDRINRIPIKALFYIYGCLSDKEIANYIFPGKSASQENISFLGDVIKNGHVHTTLPTPLTPQTALLYIGKTIMSDVTRDKLIEDTNTELDYYIHQHKVNLKSDEVKEINKNLLDIKIIEWVKDLMSYFMININDDNKKVCMELGSLVRQLIGVMNDPNKSTDRNSLKNRRVHQPGEQFMKEVQIAYSKKIDDFMRDKLRTIITTHSYDHLQNNVGHMLEHQIKDCQTAFKDAVTTSFREQTTSQPNLLGEKLDPKSPQFHFSKMNEVAIRPSAGDSQDSVRFEQRQVHPSHYGFICPAQTQEAGADVGRYQQFAIFTKVSLATDPTYITELVKKQDGFMEKIPNHNELADYYTVNINGTIIGVIPRGDKPNNIWRSLLKERRENDDIDPTIGISIDHYSQILDIHTDSGRPCSPFVPVGILENTKFGKWLQLMASGDMKWDDGIKLGMIEWIDVSMIDNCIIAESIDDYLERGKECTHIMLPAGGSGLIPALNPGTDRLKSVRSTYMTNQEKSAISQTIHNYQTLPMAELNWLIYPHKPILRSAYFDIMQMFHHGFGENCTIAFLSMADNQEDAIIMNQGAIDRGAFKSINVITKTFVPEDKTIRFGLKPYNELYSPVGSEQDYEKIDPKEGIPTKIGTIIKPHEIIAAMYRSLTRDEINALSQKGKVIKDESKKLSHDENKFARHPVTSKLIATDKSISRNNQRKSIRLASVRYPIVGDKFASQAQKGTAAKLMVDCDMPYTQSGVRPVIIFNPPPLLKRETPAQIYAALLEKVAALYGCELSSTPFTDKLDIKELSLLLEDLGFKHDGGEPMYDGITGELYITGDIFMGVTYYTRQRHMVGDKAFARYGGPKDAYSHQAIHGGRKGGGVSIGKMEYDAIRASGAALLSQDTMLLRSAPTIAWTCRTCGYTAHPMSNNRNQIECEKCGVLDSEKGYKMNTHWNEIIMNKIYAGAGIALDTFVE
jgi:DNA-directed RNA polymerase beta subunit